MLSPIKYPQFLLCIFYRVHKLHIRSQKVFSKSSTWCSLEESLSVNLSQTLLIPTIGFFLCNQALSDPHKSFNLLQIITWFENKWNRLFQYPLQTIDNENLAKISHGYCSNQYWMTILFRKCDWSLTNCCREKILEFSSYNHTTSCVEWFISWWVEYWPDQEYCNTSLIPLLFH